MRMGGVVIGGRLRSRLLVGVATLALAAPVSKLAMAQSADKWSPYLEAGGMVGINAHSFGDVDIFLPLWQDQTSLFFGNLHGQFSAAPTQEGNFGLGYRTQLNTDWILGGYGFIDIQNSQNSNLFVQGSVGAELLSVDWDFRINGYFPFNGGGKEVSGSGVGGGNGQLQIIGHNFVFQSGGEKEEFALFGVDGEVGWRVPIFPADGDMDVRLYAGGYYFARSDVDTIAGPRGRIEARLYDIDFLGLQSRLTAQGVIQWDQPRGAEAEPAGPADGRPGAARPRHRHRDGEAGHQHPDPGGPGRGADGPYPHRGVRQLGGDERQQRRHRRPDRHQRRADQGRELRVERGDRGSGRHRDDQRQQPGSAVERPGDDRRRVD